MAKFRVELSEEERGELLTRVSRGKGAANEIKRANILLAVDRREHVFRAAPVREARPGDPHEDEGRPRGDPQVALGRPVPAG